MRGETNERVEKVLWLEIHRACALPTHKEKPRKVTIIFSDLVNEVNVMIELYLLYV